MHAEAFSGIVSPARFELKGKAGQKLAQVIEIGNESPVPEEFAVHTADWELNAEGGVIFHDPLRPGSCRPWVAIERRVVKMPPNGIRRYRFEVSVPPGAPPQECRFAIVVESNAKPPEVTSGFISMPIQGRLAVIVYVAVGEVAPRLAVREVTVGRMGGRAIPVAQVDNTGNAHGRMEGVLAGVDSTGRRLEFNVSSFPILPGESRRVAIWPQDEPGGKAAEIRYPLRLKGDFEWAGGKQPIDVTLAAPPG